MSIPCLMPDLGDLISKKRGHAGIRFAAKEAGLSPATLSRIENGGTPDLATFAKLCVWLEADPSVLLGIEPK